MELTWPIVSIGSTIGWTILRLALRMWFYDRKAVAAHAVSFIHSSAAVLAIIIIKQCELSMDFYRITSTAEQLVMSVSLGYFLYDSCMMNRNWLTAVMIVHHVGSCLGLAEVIKSGRGGDGVLVVILMMEGSNPLLHLRRILHSSKLHNNTFYTCLEYLYVLVFVSLRIVWAGVVTWHMYRGYIPCEQLHFHLMLFLDFLSCLFLAAILHYIINKHSPRFDNHITSHKQM